MFYNHLVCKRTLSHLAKTDQMIELYCEDLSVRRIWLYVIIMPRTSFRVNQHSIVFGLNRVAVT